MSKNKKADISYTKIIVVSFVLIILIGAALLTLPISSRTNQYTPFLDSLFTATSATCVTGLIVYDTFTHWSVFGQIVILTMIQIGGLGLMTIISIISMVFGKKVSLHERRLLMQSAGNLKLGGMVKMIRRIVAGTILFETMGAIILAIRFCSKMGIKEGIYNAVFHSVSAFCNAGFDLMGKYEQFSSFTGFADDVVVNITLMVLIVVGGLGFVVWSDIYDKKLKLKNYQLHSKVVLAVTAVLIIIPAVLFFILEKNASMTGVDTGARVLDSIFQSVTTRTAGFNTIDMTKLSEGGNILTMFLMIIGGSPGSTAGGMKTTTLVVMIMCAVSVASKDNNVTIFKKRLDESLIKQAGAIVAIYFFIVLVFSIVISAIEPFSMKQIMFEITSAVGTVGLSCGISTQLGTVSKLIMAFIMFSGRIGGLSLVLMVSENKKTVLLERPIDKILLG